MAKRLSDTPVGLLRHILDLTRSVVVPVHPDGLPFVGAAAALTVAGHDYKWVRRIGAALTAALWFFFRNPTRVPPDDDGHTIAAPADGLVCKVDEAQPPGESGLGTDPCKRVSIFLSLTDVHLQRAPVGGEVLAAIHTPGQFLAADLPEASDQNERTVLVLQAKTGAKVACVQVAGLIARRIVCRAGVGVSLRLGQQYGLIRFGSRVDLYLPRDTKVLVKEGQRAIGGETVIGRLA